MCSLTVVGGSSTCRRHHRRGSNVQPLLRTVLLQTGAPLDTSSFAKNAPSPSEKGNTPRHWLVAITVLHNSRHLSVRVDSHTSTIPRCSTCLVRPIIWQRPTCHEIAPKNVHVKVVLLMTFCDPVRLFTTTCRQSTRTIMQQFSVRPQRASNAFFAGGKIAVAIDPPKFGPNPHTSEACCFGPIRARIAKLQSG